MIGPMRLRLWLAMALVLAVAAPSRAADDFVVIANPSVAGATMRRPDLAAVFLKKATRWGNGRLAVPVDQSGTSAVRKSFSESILGMSVATTVQYWQKQLSAANTLGPPLTKASDAEVIAFVGKTEGAVGYVSKQATLPASVRAIALSD
jgi:ABC-type phosphate transport system substrate-binding protein